MKIICKKSGLTFTVPQFRLTLSDGEHPIFSIKQNSLLAQIKAYATGELEEDAQILLFLALADSTGLIIWRDALNCIPGTIQHIATHMHRMAATVYRINEIRDPRLELPRYVMSRHGDANTILGLINGLAAWENAIVEYGEGQIQAAAGQRLLRIEENLARIVRLQARKPAAFGAAIARWAAAAGDFPMFDVNLPEGKITCSAFWQQIIVRCATGEGISKIRTGDLAELIEYCEVEIPHGSLFSAALMNTLRAAARKQREFIGAPALSGIKMFTMVPMTAEDTVIRNKELEILSEMARVAPETAPNREDFKDAFLFLRAMARWRQGQEVKKNALEETLDAAKAARTIASPEDKGELL